MRRPMTDIVPQPRLRDVAAAAGVSVTTASRVLNGSVRIVSAPMRDKVEAAAGRLGYVPDPAAQAMAGGRTNTIVLLTGDLADPYFIDVAEGVATVAEECGMILNIIVTGHKLDGEMRALRTLQGQRPTAIVVTTSRTSGLVRNPLVNELRRAGTAVVLVGGDGEAGEIAVANVDGARALGVAVSKRGYRHAFVIAPLHLEVGQARAQGFSDGFSITGGREVTVVDAELSREGGEEAVDGLLGYREIRGSVVFTAADIMALGAARALSRCDLQIGRDVALCGFADTRFVREVLPDLTTVALPLREIGRHAARAALGRDAHHAAGRFQVILRGSTPHI